jgi:hypothetical protein
VTLQHLAVEVEMSPSIPQAHLYLVDLAVAVVTSIKV